MSEFKAGDKAFYAPQVGGPHEVTVVGTMTDGRYAVEACGQVWPTEAERLTTPEPEQVERWVHLWHDGVATADAFKREPQNAGRVIARARVVLTPGVIENESTPDPYTRGWNDALDAAEANFAEKGWGGNPPGWPVQFVRALKRSTP